ncbi:hypothetical protein BDV3_000346 [Batrachochytrium dendrobatidis]|nr:Serine hydrolase-like protein 2 [Batrachochytrium dendrobatidis]KAK5667862.1 Serine hydrolase-like protein 2 [Batrachochytrium dendrobatidis]
MDYHGEDLKIHLCSGLRICGKHWGYKNGFPVLALHGWLDNCATWDVLIPTLVSKYPNLRFNILAIDFAGHGKSDHRSLQTPYAKIFELQDCINVANAFGWDTFSLLGHSMGALVSTYIAGFFPTRIVSVIAIEVVAPLYMQNAHRVEKIASGILETNKFLSRKNPELTKRIFVSVDKAVSARMHGRHKVSEPAARLLVTRGIKPVESINDFGVESLAGWVWSSDQRMVIQTPFPLSRQTAIEMLERIKCPLLCIMANHDMKQTFDTPEYKQVLDTRLEIVRFNDVASHHLHMELEFVDRVASAIALFWDKHMKLLNLQINCKL